MIVKVLVDNSAKEGFEWEHGFSIVVEADDKILFDLGPNDLFLENAKRLNIDLDQIKTVVLSHGHWDHGDGLKYISGKNLITHPDSFALRYRQESKTPVGLSMSREEIENAFTVKLSKKPFWISDQIVFLGEIPRLNNFESQKTTFHLEDESPDFVTDDSAIAIKSEKGLIVISGCAHAGICNTVSYAKQVCDEDKVYAVLGGFHLKKMDEVYLETIDFLKKENVEFVGATHCTNFKVKEGFKKHFNSISMEVGSVIEL